MKKQAGSNPEQSGVMLLRKNIAMFYRTRFVRYNLLYDLLLVTGILFSHWDPARVLAFYWIDLCTSVAFYLVYMRWIGHLRNPFKLIVSASVFTGFMLMYLYMIGSLGQHTNQHIGIFEEIDLLLQPAYEISFFVLLSVLSNLSFYKRFYILEKRIHSAEFFLHVHCGVMLLMIPGISFFTTVVFALTLNITISLLIAYLALRNRFDVWKYKKLRAYGFDDLPA